MDFYKTISKGYNELYGQEQQFKISRIKEKLRIKNNEVLLDVGCGTGISSDFNCKVIGMDPSMELIQQNIKNKILAKAENIPFRDKSFDKVVSITSIHNFDNVEQGINEIRRVGKKDFVFSVLKKSSKFDLIEEIIRKNFFVEKILDGRKDWIFICVLNHKI